MKPLNVLVIDDEKVICDACWLVLSEKGHHVTHRTTGIAGLLEIERNGGYDLILLDMKLPDIDGSQVLKLIEEQSTKMSVIVMTGYSTLSNALEAMKLGAADYLPKPFTEDDLLATIEKLFPDS